MSALKSAWAVQQCGELNKSIVTNKGNLGASHRQVSIMIYYKEGGAFKM